MKKKKQEYWLFWSHRGYMEFDSFSSKKEALKRFREEDDGYQFPILIKGMDISPKK